MTKDEERLVATIRGYLEAKKESGKAETIPYHQVSSIKMAIDALEKEIQSVTYCAACQNAEMAAKTATIKNHWKEIEILKEKLKEKTYPIDRDYKRAKEIDELNQYIENGRSENLRLFNENVDLKNKNDLLQMQIERLQEMLKEMDKGIVKDTNGYRKYTDELKSVAETNELRNKIGLQKIEIGKLNGLLKEAEDRMESVNHNKEVNGGKKKR